ncbi:MAG: hypothetical protein ACRDS0_38395 [Pseudonocardiaceae bacterium]
MTTEVTAHSRRIDAYLYGVARTPLIFSHSVADPAAVRLELPAVDTVWTVGRDVIGLGLDPDLGDRATGCECRGCQVARADRESAAATVQCYRAADSSWVLLVLRGRLGRWPLWCRARDVRGFLGRTYQYCSQAREQRLVDAAVSTQINAFSTQGNQS